MLKEILAGMTGQVTGQQPMVPPMMPQMMPQMQQPMLDPYGQQNTGLKSALMGRLGYGF